MSEDNYTMNPEYGGALFGFDIEARASTYYPDGDPHAIVVVYIEDDEVWHRQMRFSSAWVEDLDRMVQKLKAALADQNRFEDDDGCGKKFK